MVTVEDENDNDPKFIPASTVTIPAMDDPEERRFICRMMATDKDVGSNAELSYFIRDGNTQSRFYIDATTGEVTCSKTLIDGERYVLQVRLYQHCQFDVVRIFAFKEYQTVLKTVKDVCKDHSRET